MTAPGELDRRLTLEEPVETADGTGGVCPAAGAAGHSLAGSGNYHIDVRN